MRRCFPHAIAANLTGSTVTDADFIHLRGIRTLYMFGCKKVTDAGLAPLRGIRELSM